MKRRIKITHISEPKQSHFLASLDFPITLIVDVKDTTELFIEVKKGLFEREANFEEKAGRLIEGLYSQYDLRFSPEAPARFKPEHAYTGIYSDASLKPFADSLILNNIRARIVLSIKPRGGKWHISMLIGAEKRIGRLAASFFRKVRRTSPRKVQKTKPANWKPLKSFTIPRFQGIKPIPQPIEVPSSMGGEEAVRIGSLIHPVTKRGLSGAGIDLQRLNRHAMVLASTGYGKTNLCRNLAVELSEKGIPSLVMDYKDDYRDLTRRTGAKLYNFTDSNLFSFNPLKPPNSVEPSYWVKVLADIAAEVISGGAYASGAFSMYMETLDTLFRDHGIYDGGTNYPTIFDLAEALEERSERPGLSFRERDWLSSAKKLFASLGSGKTREALGVKEGISLEELLRENTVVELGGIGDNSARAFLVSVLLQKIRSYREVRNERDELKHVIFIEEAQNVLAKNREASSTLTTTYREIRSFCEGLICVSQMPTEVSRDALANTSTFFVLRLINPEDKKEVRKLMGLDSEDVIDDLEVGEALVKADELGLVRVPYLERLEVRPPEIKQEKPRRERVSSDFAMREAAAKRARDLSPREWSVLKSIGESSSFNHTSLMADTRLSGKELSRAISTLINKGFVRYAYAKRRGVGRKMKVYFLFPYGEEAYRSKYRKYPDRARAESVEREHDHTAMKEEILKIHGGTGEAGRFDLMLGEEPVEIETGSNNSRQIYENIKKSVEAYGSASFVVTGERIHAAVIQQAACYSFTERESFTLYLIFYESLLEGGEWKEILF